MSSEAKRILMCKSLFMQSVPRVPRLFRHLFHVKCMILLNVPRVPPIFRARIRDRVL